MERTLLICLILTSLAAGGLLAGEALAGEPPPEEARTLILNGGPISSADRLTDLELISRDTSLGPNQPPIEELEGRVTVGRCEIYPLSSAESEAPLASDRNRVSLYLVRFPYSLHPPEGSRRFKQVEIHVDLTGGKATAFDLFPVEVEPGGETPEDFAISPEGRFGTRTPRILVRGWQIRSPSFKPVIRAFGRGEPQFYWVFTSEEDQGVAPGTRDLLAVLEVARETSVLPVEVRYRATVAKELFGQWFSTKARSGRLPLRFDLTQRTCDAGEVKPASEEEPPLFISGRWDSDFGLIVLEQDGTQVTGTYNCCGGGRVIGSVRDEELSLTWEDPGNGRGWSRFRIESGGRRLNGTWGSEGTAQARGAWNAWRLGAEPELKGTATFWKVEGRNRQAGILEATAVIYFDGEKVTGKIEGTYITVESSGDTRRTEVVNYLEGVVRGSELDLTWIDPTNGGTGSMSLLADSNRLAGTWQGLGGLYRGDIQFARSNEKVDDP